MAIINYQGERDYTPANNQYQRLIAYLVYIENRFPALYRSLDQIPQFEYDIEICRKKKSSAYQYLSVLKVLVHEYQCGDCPDMEKLHLWRESIPSFG